ncbi:hypothetical protein Tco_0531240 [Tanacetum coccineum]
MVNGGAATMSKMGLTRFNLILGISIPQRRSTRLTPPAPVPTVDKADEMILQDTLQVSLVEHKSREKQEDRENVEPVNKHLASVEIEKMVEESENVIDDCPILRNVDQNIPGTRLEPRSDKESPEVEITNVVILVNVNEEEEEIIDEVYELKRREKGMIVEESRSTPSPTPIRSPRIYIDLVSSDTEKLQELTKTDTTPTPSSRVIGALWIFFEHLKAKFLSRKSFDTLVDHLPEVMVESLPTMVDRHFKEQVEKQVPEQVKVQVPERGRLQAEILSQIQQAIDNHIPSLVDESQQDIAIWLALQMKFETLWVNESKQSPSSSGNQEQVDDYNSWTESYASDDDEISTKQVSQDIMEEVSLTINEAEVKKIADEMLRQRCTSRDEHQYHIDQMKNFLKSDIGWESRKEILASLHPRKTTPLVQSCQRDPEALALSLINQDLLYLKKGNSGPEKIVLSLHKRVKKFNPYARYGVEHWKNPHNPHVKIFYKKRQKEPGKPKEVIVARRANECIVSITESDYKNLNKNDIEDIYLLIMNGKVPDYMETGLLWSLSVFIRSSVIWERVHDFQLGIESYQHKVNPIAPTISFPGIEKHKMFSIIYEPVHGIIYKKCKKEKKVMRHSEIHKFCDATLNKVLEGLKSYNNDVKYVYIQRDLNEYEVEYLKMFEEEIEVRLKYRNQMRR